MVLLGECGCSRRGGAVSRGAEALHSPWRGGSTKSGSRPAFTFLPPRWAGHEHVRVAGHGTGHEYGYGCVLHGVLRARRALLGRAGGAAVALVAHGHGQGRITFLTLFPRSAAAGSAREGYRGHGQGRITFLTLLPRCAAAGSAREG